ncbi:hypothetical protein [Paenarthrobacter ureafaciens]|uniref:hypothetical protein n=1 Tax=Paenarthrobacter ureafaciens TaxID=37931 RepID=UPI003570F203
MRTREVRMHAVDLDNGATFNDIPAPVLERLLKDITSAWRTRGSDTGLLIKVTGTAENGTGLTFGDTMPPTPRSSRGRCPPSSNGPPGAAAAVWPPPGPAAAGPAGSGGSAPVAPKWI